MRFEPYWESKASRKRTPDDGFPLRGKVVGNPSSSKSTWTGTQDEFASTADVSRATFNTLPVEHRRGWSGGLEGNAGGRKPNHHLEREIDSIGFMVITGCDEVLVGPERVVSARASCRTGTS